LAKAQKLGDRHHVEDADPDVETQADAKTQ
jgi:hypothetical protein